MKRISLVFMFLCSITILNAQIAEEIIEKHIEKLGGKKAWNKIQSIQLKGEFVSSQGSDEILTISKKGKLKGHKIIDGKKVVQFTFDGEHYWDLDYKSNKLTKRGNEVSLKSKKSAYEFPLTLLVAKDLGYKIELLGEENIMGADCYKLKIVKGKTFVKGKEAEDESISFINKETYLEVLTETRYIRGDNMVYTYYQDYKEVDGVLLPFTITWFVNDNQLSINVDSYILNAEIDDKIFKIEK
jgi:outer membrane lipoprotein-sorting protein